MRNEQNSKKITARPRAEARFKLKPMPLTDVNRPVRNARLMSALLILIAFILFVYEASKLFYLFS